MNKKKIVALIVAGIMTIGVVGGTLAWYTSSDNVTNVFETGKVNNPDGANGNGVEIWEKYDPAVSVVPGDTTDKLVQIQNTTDYDSFIRVKVTPSWNPIEVDGNQLLTSYIKLLFGDNNENLGDANGKWLKGNDGYYYYMGKVAGGKFTNALLSKVTLDTAAGNEYRGVKFNVLVQAESIQADNNAHNSVWTGAGSEVTGKLDNYETQNAGGNDSAMNGVTITNDAERKITVTP